MKYVICDIITAYGVMRMMVKLYLSLNIVDVLTDYENMMNCHASRSSDVLTTIFSQIMEMLNTDAESHSQCCTTPLTYIERFRFDQDVIIDNFFTDRQLRCYSEHRLAGLMSRIITSWPMSLLAPLNRSMITSSLPLGNEFQKRMWLNFADIVNIAVANQEAQKTTGYFYRVLYTNIIDIPKHHWHYLVFR